VTGELEVDPESQLEEDTSCNSCVACSSAETPDAVVPNLIRSKLPSTRHRRRRQTHDSRQRRTRQRRRRAEERDLRHRAVTVSSRLVAKGWRWHQIARLLHLSARTLRRWCHAPLVALMPRGRPVQRSAREAREEVIRWLDKHGPHLGVPALRTCFPQMGHAELSDLVRRYRRVWRARHRVPLRVLHWSGIGRVWAIDFTGPLLTLEGDGRFVLAVRELASGRQLLWRAVKEATGEVVREALADLFAWHGAPLVLKCDNGSVFTCAAVGELLAARGVIVLYSPPYWPRYNGAIEAGIGSLKERTAACAARSDHAGVWTWDDLAAAQAEANAQSRPWCEGAASADSVWEGGAPITVEERASFAAAVAEAYKERLVEACADDREKVTSEASVVRSAIELALVKCGYLQYRRRSIPPPIKRK
jgi:Integrase core domain